jgi:nondiscriminating aspartyl-tRNA synthetase
VFERVYEVAPVYRAEPSHTVRHLAEYLSLDVEMGFIEDDGDVMDLQEALLKAMLAASPAAARASCATSGPTLPALDVAFPRIPLLEARELVRERYGHASGGKDLDPEAERLLGRWALEEHGSDFVFVTQYPEAARPFYAYADGDGLTRGLDLIFRGTEITSGGQRAHEHGMLLTGARAARARPGRLRLLPPGVPPRHAAARWLRDRCRAAHGPAAGHRQRPLRPGLPAGRAAAAALMRGGARAACPDGLR